MKSMTSERKLWTTRSTSPMSTDAALMRAKCPIVDVQADAACPESSAAAPGRTTKGKGIAAATVYCVTVIFNKVIFALVGAFLRISVYKAVNGLHLPTFFTVVAAWWIISIRGPNAASMLPDFATNALYKPHSGGPCVIRSILRQPQIILRPANTPYRSQSRI